MYTDSGLSAFGEKIKKGNDRKAKANKPVEKKTNPQIKFLEIQHNFT